MKIRPVILSGGTGTRLWPLSRQHYPKQFTELLGPHSLFRMTLEGVRVPDLFDPPLIIANEDHKFFVLDSLQGAQQKEATILLEPLGRNTGAAALVAALEDSEKENKVLHLLMPSDHIIADRAVFNAAVKQATPAAAEGRIVLFGITPDYPETGYGYIRPGAALAWSEVAAVAEFCEKPDATAASQLIAEGALWNSGIFLYDPRVLIEEAKRFAPEQLALCEAARRKMNTDLGCSILGREAWTQLTNISIDCQIIEHTTRGAVVPCKMGWNDVGSWQALWQLATKDEAGNACEGPVTLHGVDHSYIRSEGPMIGVIGLSDIAVIATKDAVFVMSRAKSQEVKTLVAALEAAGRRETENHARVMRPWGHYESIGVGERFQVKHIVVQPGRSLSLQKHFHRAEHWVVVVGTALVECDGHEKHLFENQSVFIPKGSTHRLSNPGKTDLQLVEVQSGDYLGDDDIVRLADFYGRVMQKRAGG